MAGDKKTQGDVQQLQAQQLQEYGRGSILGSLLSALGLGGAAPSQASPGIVTGLSFENLVRYIIAEGAERERQEAYDFAVKKIVEAMSSIARSTVDVYLADGMDRIVHPLYGRAVIQARVGQLAMLLRQAIREEAATLRRLVDAGAPPEQVRQQAERLHILTRLSFLVIEEVYAKLVTLLHLNAPARARPPLVNVALGYDLLRV